jgi:DNA-binding SARP family transcriptional activator
VDFALLGSLEVRRDGAHVALGGLRERSLLAVLLLHANELVTTERLVDELWGDHPPKAGVKTIQVYVSRLRRLLGAEMIVTRAPGYELVTDPARIDVHRFERLAAAGRRALVAGDAATACARLREALALWRGPPLSDFAYEPFAQPHAARLEELRLTAIEDRCEADLSQGRASELIAELQALAARHPLRERVRRHLMLALYRSGRQADALDVYRDTRATLVEELGIEPGRELQRLERAILEQDPSLERPALRGAGVFVGREAELATLLAGVDRVRDDAGTMFLVSGEPGIGKSRLADELAAHARDRGMRVLRGRCWERGGAPAFWPWVQVLRAAARGDEAEALQATPELAELVPDLRDAVADARRPSDPEAQRFRLFDAVATLLRAQPTVVVLEDLHSADEPSLRLLEFVAAAAHDAPLVVVGTARDDLVRLADVSRVALPPLERGAVRAYVEAIAGRPVSARAIDAIYERTAGNPLFVAETVRVLAAERRLDRADVETAVPPGAREAIERRLQPLSETARAALAVASALGREFEPDVIEHVAGDVADGLDETIAAGLVRAASGAPGSLHFSHGLVRDAVYHAIPARRRREIHRRIAEDLARRYATGPGQHFAALAHHAFEAGAPQAVEYAVRAAEHANGQFAFEESARLYGLALEALQRHGRSDAARICDLLLARGEAHGRAGEDAAAKTAFLDAAAVARRAGLGERLARAALGYGGRWVWTAMRDDSIVIPLLEEGLAALPEEDSPLRARLLARLAAGPLKALGDASRERRFALSAEAVAMARRLGEREVLAWTLDGRKVAIWGPDTLEEHWRVIQELREMAEATREPEQLVDAHICALIMIFERFEVHRFDAEYARAEAAARALRQPGQRWLVAVMAPMHALLVGRLADAERLIEEAFAIGRAAAPWNARMSRVLQLSTLRKLQGRSAEAVDELRAAAVENPEYPVLQGALASLQADAGDVAGARAAFEGLAADGFAAVPFDDEWLATLTLLADACAFLGDRERAADLYERLLPYADRAAVAPPEIATGSAGRAVGKLAATLGRTAEAARWLDHAAEQNERAGALPWAADARRERARLPFAAGQPVA